MKTCYSHPRPALTVDAVVLGTADGQPLKVLLIQRARAPFKDYWALPGGFVELDETLEQAAHRELQEETGLKDVPLRELGTYSAVHRDPRERVISIAFTGTVPIANHTPRADDDASATEWFPITALPPLAFDHAEIIANALARFV
jgi:8-oxo-dGTP diphosphatase